MIYIRKGRTWAIAVRRGSYESLFLLISGCFPWEIGKFSSDLWFAQNGLNRYGPSSFPSISATTTTTTTTILIIMTIALATTLATKGEFGGGRLEGNPRLCSTDQLGLQKLIWEVNCCNFWSIICC